MKKVLFLSFVCLAVVSFISDNLFSQVTTGPLKSKCGMDIYRGTGDVLSHGIYNNTGTNYCSFTVGRTSFLKERAVVQWDVPDNWIPDGSTVTSVTLTLTYSKINDDNQPNLTLSSVGVNLESSPNLNDLWTNSDPGSANGIGTTEGFVKESNNITGTFAAGSGFARAIEASLPGNKFTLGMAWMYENNQQNLYREWFIGSNAYLTITYKPKTQSLTVDQKLSNGILYGNFELFERGDFVKYPAHTTFSLNVNSIQYFRADTNKATIADEKFNCWDESSSDVINHKTVSIKGDIDLITANFSRIGTATVKNALEGLSSVSGDTISFKDPWLRDDESDPKGLTNRGPGAIWHPHSSPFIQNISSTRFKGVLLNQSRNNSSYYSVLAKPTIDAFLSQTGKTHRFYFQNWTSANAEVTYPMVNETPVVFTANNAEVLANYKGSMLSNTQTAFSNSSQRKFIMTPQANHPYGGDLHMVYESMGKIWYERSTDGGTTWTIENGGKPLNTDYVYTTGMQFTGTGSYTTAKHPSIDYYQDKAVIVWQEQSGSNYLVRICFMQNGVHIGPANCIPFTSYGLYSEDIWPQIAVKDGGNAVIAIRRNDAYMKGLEVHYMTLYPEGGMAQQETAGFITGTNENTGSFTLATDRSATDKFHIAWQQIASSSSSSMQYAKLNFTYQPGGEIYSPANSGSSEDASALLLPPPEGQWNMNILKTVNVSNATSYTKSFSPSMIGVNDGSARLAFKGFIRSYMSNGLYYVSSCGPDNLSWIPYLNKYGGELFSPQISLGSEVYFVGWTQVTGGVYRTVVTDALTLRNMETLDGTSGRDMQINNGGTRLQQFAIGFNSESASLPYSFLRSTSAIGNIQVNKKAPVLSGRGVFLTKGESQVYFILGNIISEGMNIDFIKSQDSVSLDGDLKKVNSFMTTEPFSMKESSSLTFAVNYGFKDSMASVSLMKDKEAASFSVELVDDASGRVIGKYLDEKLDKNNIFTLKESSFKVNSDGIGSRLVRLRLSVNENMKSQYTISDMFMGDGMLLSKSLKEMGINGSLEVKEYSLSQNYPNPFNPVTLISYTLPRASKVSLRVYDILGKEVAALVNGFEEMGKYSVEFNASTLPSGIYIYELRANDFVKSGKMMLLK